MRGYYIHYRDPYDQQRAGSGIERKVADQIKALNDADCNCEFLLCPQPEMTVKMILSCLPGFPDGIQWPDPESLKGADYVYIRRPRFASKELMRFLSALKEVSPNTRILYEVPTYPYDDEMDNAKMIMALKKDRKYRKGLKDHVDVAVDLTQHESIFGIPTVQCFNGIDLDRIKPRSPQHADGDINIMCAAFYTPTHGIDRFIEGMRIYKERGGTRPVHLHLAGGGEQLPALKKMVKAYGLEENVHFYGPLDGDALDALYDTCGLALGILGLHRVDAQFTSALKTREYLAKGMPFVYGGRVDVFDRDPVDFCLEVPDSEDPIQIDEVIEHYDRLYCNGDPEWLVAKIREYAEEHIGMDSAMRKVIEYIAVNPIQSASN